MSATDPDPAPDLHALDGEIRRQLGLGTGLPGTRSTPDHRDLWAAFGRATDGGKRFRPALLVSTHRALGGDRADAALQVGAALELLHTAFVVQDDVIDGDQVRRGVPNLSGSFAQEARRTGVPAPGARRYGDAAGILAGDLGLFAAFRAITRCDAPAPVIDHLLDLVERTVHASAAGELADVRLQLGGDDAELEDTLAVADLKTAVYSFQFPLQAGAILADAPGATVSALEEIGELLGIGFQLFDDLLGVFGDELRTGKSAAGDLREGKRTALLAHAATTTLWPRLAPLVGRPDLDADGARQARELLTASGSRAWTDRLARDHLDRALAAAHTAALPAPLIDVIRSSSREILRTAELMLTPPARAELPA